MAVKKILLLRHAQYDPEDKSGTKSGGGLTETGIQQAVLTAQRLQKYPITHIYVSSMTRTMQTAAIISSYLPQARLVRTHLLRETFPPFQQLVIRHVEKLSEEKISEDRKKLERVFQHYFTPSKGEEDECHLLVCHGNVIRYLVCRVLGVNVQAWMNMHIHNCGLSSVEVNPYGFTCLEYYNDTHHLPEELRTDNLTSVGFG